MTIYPINNRKDWYCATQEIKGRIFIEFNSTRIGAIKSVISEILKAGYVFPIQKQHESDRNG